MLSPNECPRCHQSQRHAGHCLTCQRLIDSGEVDWNEDAWAVENWNDEEDE